MKLTRDMRRCALQAMYQFDFGHEDSSDIVRESLRDSPGDEAAQQGGFEFALRAWKHRSEADPLIAELSPDWPVYRQPVIDRNILRMAHYEMRHTDIPPKATINEAVELAKEYSTDRSPQFINGVLDRMYRRLLGATAQAETDQPEVDVHSTNARVETDTDPTGRDA